MSDLVKRLRLEPDTLCGEAADEIEQGVQEWRRLMTTLCEYEEDYQKDRAHLERLRAENIKLKATAESWQNLYKGKLSAVLDDMRNFLQDWAPPLPRKVLPFLRLSRKTVLRFLDAYAKAIQ